MYVIRTTKHTNVYLVNLKDKHMKKLFNNWLHENVDLINELKDEYGKREFVDILYNTEEFEQLVMSVNNNTEEEQGYNNGWTDDKDELFCDMLEKFIRLTK
jgi:hypothetical protein